MMEYKIFVLGPAESGKTCFIDKLMYSEPNDGYYPSTNISTWNVIRNDADFILYDIPGHMSNNTSELKHLYKDESPDAIIILCSIIKSSDYEEYLRYQYPNFIDKNVPILIVANKYDLLRRNHTSTIEQINGKFVCFYSTYFDEPDIIIEHLLQKMNRTKEQIYKDNFKKIIYEI